MGRAAGLRPGRRTARPPVLRLTMNRTLRSLALALSILPAPAVAQGFSSGIYLPINDVALSTPGGGSVVTNGNALLSFPGSTFVGTLDANEDLQSLDGTVNVHASLVLDVRADVSGSFSGDIDLPITPLPPFQVGPTILVLPWAYATVELEGTVQAGTRVSVVAPFQASMGVSIFGSPFIQVAGTPSFKPAVGAPDPTSAAELDLQVKLGVGVFFSISINGVSIGGPSVEASLGIGIEVAPLASAWWSATGLTLLTAEWAFGDPSLGMFTLPGSKLILAQSFRPIGSAPGALPFASSSSRWSRTYDLGDAEEAKALVATTVSRITVVGNGAGVAHRPWLASIDGFGVPTRETLAVSQVGGSMRPEAMAKAADGDLLVAGWTSTSGGMRVERYRPTGVPRWAFTMAGPASTLVQWNGILPSSTGGAILGGKITYPGAGSPTFPVLAEVNAVGTLQWMTELTLGAGATKGEIFAIALTPGGEILAVGKVEYGNAPAQIDATMWGRNALVVRLDAQGNALRANAIGAGGWDEATCVAVFPDGGYAIAGEVPKAGGGSEAHSNWIASFDAADVLRWSATYAGEVVSSSTGDTGNDEVTGVAALENGHLLACGTSGSGANQDSWLMRVDALGVPVWFKSLRGPAEDHLAGIASLGNGLIAHGHTKSLDLVDPIQNDLWIVRTSHDGMLDFGASTGMDVQNDAAQWSRTTEVIVEPLAPANVPGALTATAAPLAVVAALAALQLLTQ